MEELLLLDIFQHIYLSSIINTQHITNFIRTDDGCALLDKNEKRMFSKTKKGHGCKNWV